MHISSTLILSLLLPLPVLSAVVLPQASPRGSVSRTIGVTEVTVDYHSPGVKGRTIWGDLVPFGEVWRLGANNATTIELSSPVRMNGIEVPAGKYALFAIPGETEWTVIVNSQAQQWGAFFYDQKNDVARFEATPLAAPETEWMTFTIRPISHTEAELEMRWDRLRLPISIEVDTPAIVWSRIETALAANPTWEDWHQAARYALDRGERLDQALTWIDRAMAEENFYNFELKARLLHANGRTGEALPLLRKAREMAKGSAPEEYIEGLTKTITEWSAPE